MLSTFRSWVTYANVMATLALFIALGGSSYAALSVTGRDVKNSSLTGSDVKNSSLTTSDVRNGSLLSADFKAGQLPSGPQGPAGPEGPRGTTGATGSPGLSGLERVFVSGPSNNSISPKQVTATCPAGKVAIGGGYDLSGGKPVSTSPNGLSQIVADVVLPSSASVIPGTVTVEAWEANTTSDTWGVSAVAMCANVAP